MHWLAITITARFLIALGVILDKFLLTSKKVTHPAIYAFYSGILSAFVIAFIPFGFSFLSVSEIWLSFFSGIIFIYGILFLFFAISKNEASQVAPAVGAIIPIVTYLLSFVLSQESINEKQLLGMMLLVLGGLLISYNIKKKNKKSFSAGFYQSLGAGVFLAVAFSLYKILYLDNDFLNVFIWTRFGLIAGAFTLLLIPRWRQIIMRTFKNFKTPKKEHYHVGQLFVLNKILNGTGSIILNYAISLGSVTIINALVSLEYVFVFLLGLVFSGIFPEVFREKKDLTSLAQKISSIAIISLGIFLVYK